jgi:UDP-glucose 4-epimerase
VNDICCPKDVTILKLARRVVKLSGSSTEIKFVLNEEAFAPGFDDMHRQIPSIDNIKHLIGYSHFTLEDNLDKMIEIGTSWPFSYR